MAYFVDTGCGHFDVFDESEKDLALECAEKALEDAREFHRKMGFVPFWGKCVEIRRGKLSRPYKAYGEVFNQQVVAETKVWRVLAVEVAA